ncbi:hypothetical protein CaCOL14_009324 [Colletotrichum acutatum]
MTSELESPPALPPTNGDCPTDPGSGGKKKKKKKMMMITKKVKKAQARAKFDSVEYTDAAGAYEEPEPAVEAYEEPEPAVEAYEEPEPAVEAYEEPKPAIEAYEEPEPQAYHESGQDLPEEQVVKFLVSSRHLALASRYFYAKLSGPWMEASVKHIDGCYHMDASDWDSDALLVLMQVIHGKTRSVPRRIDLEMLAKLAFLVDYYDCHEVIEIYCPLWIESLRDTLPVYYGRDVVLWLLISYIFQQDDIFQQMTHVAISKSVGPIRTMELPIPSGLVGKFSAFHILSTVAKFFTDLVDWRRQDAVEFILEVLHSLLDSFRNETAGCSFECSSILLGALTKEMDKHKMLNPKPAKPYSGYSIVDMEKIVRAFRSPMWSSDFFLDMQQGTHAVCSV